jgi:FrmR/RcnR family transcriptional regulator, repressor of frmRAB operon
MGHTSRDREKLLARVKKIRGQLNAVEKSLVEGEDCSQVLMTLAACRGGLNSLMSEILEGHIRFHIVDPDHKPGSKQAQATAELIELLRTYLR